MLKHWLTFISFLLICLNPVLIVNIFLFCHSPPQWFLSILSSASPSLSSSLSGPGPRPAHGTGTNPPPRSLLSVSHPDYTHHSSNGSVSPNPGAFPLRAARFWPAAYKIAMDLDPMNKRKWQISWGNNAQCQRHTASCTFRVWPLRWLKPCFWLSHM